MCVSVPLPSAHVCEMPYVGLLVLHVLYRLSGHGDVVVACSGDAIVQGTVRYSSVASLSIKRQSNYKAYVAKIEKDVAAHRAWGRRNDRTGSEGEPLSPPHTNPYRLVCSMSVCFSGLDLPTSRVCFGSSIRPIKFGRCSSNSFHPYHDAFTKWGLVLGSCGGHVLGSLILY